MGTVVVGYVPKPEGEAALAAGINEAKLRGSKLVVVNSHRGGQDFDRIRCAGRRGRHGRHPEASSMKPVSSTTSASSSAVSSPPRT